MSFLQKPVSTAGNTVITVQDILDILESLQIKKGDIVCVHSQLFNFGKPLLKRQEFLETIIEILKEAVGKTGLLIMPAFSYSFCNNELFDIQNSPSKVGILSEYFRKLPDVQRTGHPVFSFALWGEQKEDYLDIGPDAFSLDSVYGKMIRDAGKILMLGADRGYTFYYLAEEHVGVQHRYFKVFSGKIRDNGNVYHASVPYFVRDLTIRSEVDESKLSRFLIESACQRQISFANGTLSVIDCKKTYDTLVDALCKDEKMFL